MERGPERAYGSYRVLHLTEESWQHIKCIREYSDLGGPEFLFAPADRQRRTQGEIQINYESDERADTDTEAAIIEAIERLHRVHTIVTSAHRLTTVRGCDQIVLLEAGRISAQGNWETVAARSAIFQRMASIAGGGSRYSDARIGRPGQS